MPPLCEPSPFASLLQKCASATALDTARRLHALVLTTRAVSPYVNNNLLSMYARCGSLDSARQVFDRMPQRNVVSYNALISAYSRVPGRASSALGLFARLGDEGLRPNGLTFTSLFQACSLLEDRFASFLLHGRVVKCGFADNVCVQTSILGMYSSFGDLKSAGNIFRCIVDKDAVVWNSMILGSLKNDRIGDALLVFREMLASGVSPTQFTYSIVLNACAKLEHHTYGRIVHGRVIVSGTTFDLPMENALLDMYLNCGDISTAQGIFDGVQNPDIVSWNSLISGYTENGHGEVAIEIFIRLMRLLFPKPDEYTIAAAISATGTFLVNDCGKALHGQVIKAGFESSIYVGTTLISMYFTNGENGYAHNVFHSLPVKDVVIWTEMITAHSKLEDAETAMKFFYEMYKEGHKTDSFALSGALSACADLAVLKQGEMIHSLAVKMGYDVDMAVCGSLVDMYAKTGNLQAADLIFSDVSNPDLKCYNSMLGGYGYHGLAEKALELFDEILVAGLLPDQVTFLSALSACNHSSLVKEGKNLWNCMRNFNLRPGPKHYSCMVSLLSRAGLLEEAEEMINKSPFYDDHLELWRTLLSSSVNYQNLRMGIRAAEHVLSLDVEDTATHILLSNLYAAAGKWDVVAETRRKIRGLSMDKDPGLSWIESQDTINAFSSGDQLHPTISKIQSELNSLIGNMKRLEVDEFDSIICGI
ncbi:hypothetical protein ACJRO7_034579 [Eucalyptus globulus]|uniref:Pentatricopeptide repeat-containing protein n=1 Tax=Eucalyptus globulus TaxID=34317 RepID=A0ABD3J6I1_EUCGL